MHATHARSSTSPKRVRMCLFFVGGGGFPQSDRIIVWALLQPQLIMQIMSHRWFIALNVNGFKCCVGLQQLSVFFWVHTNVQYVSNAVIWKHLGAQEWLASMSNNLQMRTRSQSLSKNAAKKTLYTDYSFIWRETVRSNKEENPRLFFLCEV